MFLHVFGCEISQLCEFCKDSRNALFNRLFVGLDDQFGMFWLLVRIIDTREILDFALVNELVEALDVALAADIKGASDIHFNKIANLFPCPVACIAVGSNSGGDADHTVAC